MAKATRESLQEQWPFSGRTIGKMLRKRRGGGNTSSEHRGLRRKGYLDHSGKDRWIQGFKYRFQGEWITKPDGKQYYQEGPPCPGI